MSKTILLTKGGTYSCKCDVDTTITMADGTVVNIVAPQGVFTATSDTATTENNSAKIFQLLYTYSSSGVLAANNTSGSAEVVLHELAFQVQDNGVAKLVIPADVETGYYMLNGLRRFLFQNGNINTSANISSWTTGTGAAPSVYNIIFYTTEHPYGSYISKSAAANNVLTKKETIQSIELFPFYHEQGTETPLITFTSKDSDGNFYWDSSGGEYWDLYPGDYISSIPKLSVYRVATSKTAAPMSAQELALLNEEEQTAEL